MPLPCSFRRPPLLPSSRALSVSLVGEPVEGVSWVGDFRRIRRPHAQKLGRGRTAVRKSALKLC
jgi:hypothetical protein